MGYQSKVYRFQAQGSDDIQTADSTKSIKIGVCCSAKCQAISAAEMKEISPGGFSSTCLRSQSLIKFKLFVDTG